MVLANEGEVQRMVTNLVLDARDAMRDGGTIALRLQRRAESGVESARIEVEDNG